jgi:Dyp-type peroxidase family
MVPPIGEYHDMQAILRSGFGRLEEACFLLLRIAEPGQARAWLAAVIEEAGTDKRSYRVTHAGHLESQQEQVLQVAFTARGLQRLGLPEDLFPGGPFERAQGGKTGTFSAEFCLGMAGEEAETAGCSRRLGDVGENAPSNWEWGIPDDRLDALVMLYAREGCLTAFERIVRGDLEQGFKVCHRLHTAPAPHDKKLRREPFGFMDGISQPQIDWAVSRAPGTRVDLEYGNLIAAGEFLLGYPNEYGLYTHRPLLNAERDPDNLLCQAEDDPSRRDLGRNGTYLVLRQLEQDVSGFWQFVYAQSPNDKGIGLAEGMVGRRLLSGDPLVAVSGMKIRGVCADADDIRQNGFTFKADPDGLACPFGAHIRRANPRTADLAGGRQGFISRLCRMLGLKRGGLREDLLSSSRFHRIIRRGRPYSEAIGQESGQQESPRIRTGLHFIALNANIARQFQFIQNSWIVNSKFNGLDGESDPLLGNRREALLGQRTDGFSLPQARGPNRRIAGLPQFVTVRGGAYFFLPSLRALRFLARQSGNV